MDLGRRAAALAALAPPGVTTGIRGISASDVAQLHPEENAAVARAVDRRKHEFATGRALLRLLLGTDDSILVGPTRAPILPSGTIGSLAHDRSCAVAAVSRDLSLVALGVDVEPAELLSDDMARIILRADEVGIDAHLAFTLKEAAYKAWSNAGGPMLDHHDVRLTAGDGRFVASIVNDGRHIDGRFATVDGAHLALAAIRVT